MLENMRRDPDPAADLDGCGVLGASIAEHQDVRDIVTADELLQIIWPCLVPATKKIESRFLPENDIT